MATAFHPLVLAVAVLVAGLAGSAASAVQERTAEFVAVVRDPAGGPVAGAEVSAFGGDWHAATTDGAGQARLPVAPGTWDVVVIHPDLGIVPSSRSVTVRAGERRAVEFQALPRSVEIKGRVHFRSEPPLTLAALHAAAYPEGPATGSLPVSVSALAEDRSFALRIPPGRWRIGLLEVVHAGVSRPVVAAPGQESRVELEVDFRGLTGAAGLVFEAGLITERIGPAFSLTTVGLYAIGGDRQHRILAITQARADQTFAILAAPPAGTALAVFAWRPGGTAVPAAVRIFAAPGEAAFADFRFVVNSGTLTGAVVDGAGRPVAEAWVAVASAVRHEEWMMEGRPVHALDGAFRTRVPLGPVLVRAWRDPRRPGEPVRVSVPSPAPVVVRLEVP